MLVDYTCCHAHVEADEIGNFHHGPGEYNEPGRYALLRCKRCRSPLLIEQDNIGNVAKGGIWAAPTVLYPQPDLRVNPKALLEIRTAI